jgi:hypothetical protein
VEDIDIFETLEQVNSGQENSGGLFNVPKDIEFWYPKPKETGPSKLVILPYVTSQSPYVGVGKMYYMRDYFLYRWKEGEHNRRYFDSRKTFNEKCAVADSFEHYEGDKPRRQRMALLNVLQILDDGTEKLVIMDFSFANFLDVLMQDIAAKIKKNEKKYGHLRKFVTAGTVIDFSWEIENYAGREFCKAVAFDYEEYEGNLEKWIPKCVDLDKSFNKLSYAEVQSKFFGIETKESAESDSGKTQEAKTETKKVAEVVEPKFKKNDTVYFEGKKYTVVKVSDTGIKVMDEDADVTVVQEDDLTFDVPVMKTAEKEAVKKTENPAKKEAKTASAVAGTDSQEKWDANWDDE